MGTMCRKAGYRITTAIFLALGLAACGGGGSNANGGNGGGVSIAPMCYVTLSGVVTEYVGIEIAKGQSCGTLAFAMQQSFYGATVTSDGSSKPWGSGYSAACIGTLTSASDPSSVVAQGGDDSGGVCNTLGFNTAP